MVNKGEIEQKFIKFINPSFQKFNRPFLIALTVFLIVHAIIAGITAALMKICS